MPSIHKVMRKKLEKIKVHILRVCSDFDRTVRGAPFPHTTSQERWVLFAETRLAG